MVSEDIPQQVATQDDTIAEEWVRLTKEPDIRGVSATRGSATNKWSWRVTVWAAAHVREEPLEREMRDAIDGALRAVAGVTEVAEEDREVWIIAGAPTGEALVRAAAEAIDGLAEKIRAHLGSA